MAPLSEYPPTDYRALVEAAAARYRVTPAEILVGAGADEILDVVAKVFIPPGGRAIVPIPTYAMYPVLTEQRGATVVGVPRLGETAGWALDLGAVRAATTEQRCSGRLAVQPEQPDRVAGAGRRDRRRCLTGLATDAGAAGRPAPVVVLDEAYAEFVGTTLLGLRDVYPNLIVVRTASKAYALAGLRVGFAVARPEVIARLNPFRPPGSISTVSVTLVTEALARRLDPRRQPGPSRDRADPADRGPAGRRLEGRAVGHELRAGRPRSTERAAAVAEGLLARGLVPRTFGAGHPLADHLRLTVRAADENDRLIAAATELANAEAGQRQDG